MGNEDLHNTIADAVETVAAEVDATLENCVDALTNVSEASYQETASAEAANMTAANTALADAESHLGAAYEAVGLDAPEPDTSSGDSGGGWIEGNIF